MKCKHDPGEAIRELRIPPIGGVSMPVITLRCGVCNSALPLGPANDAPEAVTIEIRAADLVADPNDVSRFSQVEWAGYCDDEEYSVGGGEPLRRFDLDGFEWSAGHLARCIDVHGEEG